MNVWTTAALLLVVVPVRAQQPAQRSRAAPFSLDVGGYYQQLDNGYSDWTGIDARLGYTGERIAPFALLSTQHRREGTQSSYGLGSYLTLSRRVYSIVDFSVATGGTAVFFPRLRWDASVLAETRPGLVVNSGFTYVSFGGRATATIASIGPIWYHGPWILSGLAHLNHDGAGGANTGSADVAGQYGAEGHAWTGASLSVGHEAYQTVTATPFDAEFTNIGGTVFHQRWLTSRTAILARLEYQHKLTAYQRRGIFVSYRVAF